MSLYYIYHLTIVTIGILYILNMRVTLVESWAFTQPSSSSSFFRTIRPKVMVRSPVASIQNKAIVRRQKIWASAIPLFSAPSQIQALNLSSIFGLDGEDDYLVEEDLVDGDTLPFDAIIGPPEDYVGEEPRIDEQSLRLVRSLLDTSQTSSASKPSVNLNMTSSSAASVTEQESMTQSEESDDDSPPPKLSYEQMDELFRQEVIIRQRQLQQQKKEERILSEDEATLKDTESFVSATNLEEATNLLLHP